MTNETSAGDSRRSFMAKSALATGTLALGSTAFGTATVGAQEDRVAVFADNYYPGADFDVVSQLETSTTVEILQVEGETVPEISQPDEWSGHIIRYDIGTSGITTFLFMSGQTMSAGDSGTMGEDASVLSPQLNLLSTSLDGGGGTDGEDFEDEEENVTDEENVTVEEENVTVEENVTIEEENDTAAIGGE